MTEDKKRSAGAKPVRTETVTVRLDPKLRYLAELAARKQRRTVSSFIEWAVAKSLESVNVYEGSGYNGDQSTSFDQAASGLWDVDESERFVKLALQFPELLTHEEQERWKMLLDSGLLGPGRYRLKNGSIHVDHGQMEDRVYPLLRTIWPQILEAQAAGEAARQKWIRDMSREVREGHAYEGYPAKKPKTSSGFDDMDDDIPF
jgi:hypothetical protein